MLEISRRWVISTVFVGEVARVWAQLPGAARHGVTDHGPGALPLRRRHPLQFARQTRARLCGGRPACVGLVALLLALVAGAPAARGQDATPPPVDAAPPSERIVVALLPLVIHSLDDQSFLRDGLSDMLLSRLGRDQRLAIVPVAGEGVATNDLETARGHARGVGAAYVVYGSFTHFGQGASVDVSAAAVDGDTFGPRQVFVHAGALGEIIPTLDGLADRVTRFVLEGPAQVAGAVGGGGAEGASSAELEDIVRRLEALERAVDPEVAVEGDVEVPSIFQVYPEDGGSATN